MENIGAMTMGSFRRITKDVPDHVPLHIDYIAKGVASVPANKVLIVKGETEYKHIDLCRFVEGERE